MEFDKEVLKGHIDTIILSIISRREVYGYELAKQVLEKSKGRFELKEGTMYLALKRLEKNGFIASYWSDEESGGGRRKYYRMTDSGRRKLELKRAEWEDVRSVMDSFLYEPWDDGGIR